MQGGPTRVDTWLAHCMLPQMHVSGGRGVPPLGSGPLWVGALATQTVRSIGGAQEGELRASSGSVP